MASLIELWNMAIVDVGGDPITDPSETKVEANACRAVWNPVRQATLRLHPTNSVTRRASLPAAGGTPTYGYLYHYAWPISPFCLRPLLVADADGNIAGVDWRAEGRKILTDLAAPIKLEFIADIADVESWDALLVEAASAHLAWKICFKVSRSRALTADKKKAWEDWRGEHRSVDAQEGTPVAALLDSFIDARA